jgi:hypothetical protein
MKKYQKGGFKSRMVTTSPNGNYRTVDKFKENKNSTKESSSTRRTLLGALRGAPKAKEAPSRIEEGDSIQRAPLNSSGKLIESKKGGSITFMDQVQKMYSKKKK